ncbi:MAG: hypothetical protein ACON39_06720 [Coraliomargaritaceae bacterium]
MKDLDAPLGLFPAVGSMKTKFSFTLHRFGIVALCAYQSFFAASPNLFGQLDDAAYEAEIQATIEAQMKVKPIHLINLLYMRNPSTEAEGLDRALSLFYTGEDEDFRINAFHGSLSRTIRYDGPSQFMFFDRKVSELGEVIRTPLVELNLGRPGPKIILLTTKEDGTIIGRVLRTDKRNFPDNVVRVLNYSDQPTRVQVQNTADDLPVRSINDFSVEMDDERAMVPLIIAGFTDGEAHLVARRKIGMRDGGRELVIIYSHPRDNKKLSYALHSVAEQTFYGNFSDKKVSEKNTEYHDLYIPAAKR